MGERLESGCTGSALYVFACLGHTPQIYQFMFCSALYPVFPRSEHWVRRDSPPDYATAIMIMCARF